tara:strand:- start:38 stop:748 length:711 start_codon:yes stop_codon:yes gene_type:complete
MNKTILITGASGGIGFSLANKLKDQFNLILTSSRIESVDELKKDFPLCEVLLLNMKSIETINEGIQLLSKKKIFGIVHCSGIMNGNMLLFEKPENLLETFNINCIGPILVTKELLKGMIKTKEGSIIFIGSAVAHYGGVGKSFYSASKSALYGFVKSISKELGRANIRVNSISPGYIKTTLTENLSDAELDNTIKSISLRRGGNAEEVSSLINFLLSENSKYITGEDIKIDGGMVL